MSGYAVIRIKVGQRRNFKEYRTRNGTWSPHKTDAYLTSEEDAKAIVRTVTIADYPPAKYLYDYELA